MSVEEMAEYLLKLAESMAYWGNRFPYRHTYGGAGVPTMKVRTYLAPAGYMTYEWDDTGDVYTITRAGYELIRDRLPKLLRAQGDAYYLSEKTP